MGFALYELALHPVVQAKLRAEIMEVMTKYNQELTYEATLEMSYLEMVISGECCGYLTDIQGL
jgi:cytochrome P450 family 6